MIEGEEDDLLVVDAHGYSLILAGWVGELDEEEVVSGEAEKDGWIGSLLTHGWLLKGELLFGGGVVGVFEVIGLDLELVQNCSIVHGKLVEDMIVCDLIEVIEGGEFVALEYVI